MELVSIDVADVGVEGVQLAGSDEGARFLLLLLLRLVIGAAVYG